MIKSLQKTYVFLFFAVVAAYSAHDISNLDIWYHLRCGQFILDNFKIPQTNTFSYIAVDRPSFDLYWLFQVLIYLIHRVSGISGLVAFKMSVLIAAFCLLINMRKKEDGYILPAFCLVLGAMAANARFIVRPELASYLFLCLYFFILHRYHNRKGRSIYLLIPLQILWANMHGFWVLGLFLVWAFLLGEAILWKAPLPFDWRGETSVQGRDYTRLLLAGLVLTASTLITPYPHEILQLPFEMFAGLKGASGRGGPLIVNELISPFSADTLFSWQAIFYYKVLVAVSAASFLLNFRRINIIHLLIYAGFLYISVQARRNICAFALMAAPITFLNLGSFYKSSIEEFLRARKLPMNHVQAVLSVGLVLVMILLIYDAASDRYYIRDRSNTRFGLGVSNISYPKKAIDFIQENNITGNIFNNPAIGHYFTWRCFPERLVFLDGRFDLPGRFLSHYYVPQLWPKISEKYQINYVLLGHGRSPNIAPLTRMLYFSKDWVLIYYDEMAVVFVKNVEENRKIIEKFQVRFDATQNEDAPGIIRKNLFGVTDLPVAQFQLANLYATLGLNKRAIKKYEKCADIFPSFWEARSNLGDMYRKDGRVEDALKQYKMAVETKPNFAAGHVRLGDAYAATGMFQQAVQAYNEALKRKPELAVAHSGLGFACMKMKKYKEAIQHFKAVLRLDPDNSMAGRMLAYCRRMISQDKSH
jgi:hypothetical protein